MLSISTPARHGSLSPNAACADELQVCVGAMAVAREAKTLLSSASWAS